MLNKKLEPYIPIAELISKTFGNDCEVVIHDLEVPQNSVVYAVNNHVTGRKIGQSFDHLVKQVLLSQNFSNDFAANYYFHTPDGRLIKSSTALLKDTNNKVVGALCVNLDTTQITDAIHRLSSFLPNMLEKNIPNIEVPSAKLEHVSEIVDDLIDKIIGNRNPADIRREEKVDMIKFMEEKGIFLIKGAIDKVAQKMNISKVTVYSYIDVVREKKI